MHFLVMATSAIAPAAALGRASLVVMHGSNYIIEMDHGCVGHIIRNQERLDQAVCTYHHPRCFEVGMFLQASVFWLMAGHGWDRVDAVAVTEN